MNVTRSVVRTSRALGAVAMCGVVAHAAPPDPCSLLTAQQVTAVLGAPAGQGQATGPKFCEWGPVGAPPMGGKKVYLTLLSAQGFQGRITPINDPAVTKTPVSGIGDQANYGVMGKGPGTLAVKKGDVYFAVEVMGFPAGQERAKETTLAQEIVAKL